MGVEPLNTGERLSGDVAVDHGAAPLPGNYLLHLSEHDRDEAGLGGVAAFRAVPVGVPREGAGGVRGDEGRQDQQNGSAGPVHFVCRPRGRRRCHSSWGSIRADRLSLDGRRQFGNQLGGLKHLTRSGEGGLVLIQDDKTTCSIDAQQPEPIRRSYNKGAGLCLIISNNQLTAERLTAQFKVPNTKIFSLQSYEHRGKSASYCIIFDG